MASSVKACPDPCSEGKDDNVNFEQWDIAEEGVNAANAGILMPAIPIFELIMAGLINNSIGDCVPQRQDITHDASLDGRVNSSQDIVWGNGKFLLK
jgi:hypothetical protein